MCVIFAVSIMHDMDNSGQSKNPDEIEIGQIFASIGRVFGKIGNSIIGAIAGIRSLFFQNKGLFAAILILGLVLGGLYFYVLQKTYYRSTMVLRCTYLSYEVLQSNINTLNALVESDDAEALAEVLKIDENTASNIAEFDFKGYATAEEIVETELLKEQIRSANVQNKELAESLIAQIESQHHDAFEIIVDVYDPVVVRALDTAVVNFFKYNSYIKRRLDSHEAQLRSRRAKLIMESSKLDSLKGIVFQNYQSLAKNTSRGSNNVILGEDRMANPLDLFREDLTINEQILEIDQQLYVHSDFEVLQGFTAFKKPDSPGLFKILAIALGLSFLAGYLVIAAISFDRMLARYSANKNVQQASQL